MEKPSRKPGYSFGTFGGVFTPSLLMILGVIMFLRFNTVVGYAGLWNALFILAGAKAISLITGLSISSISTNMRVKGGGAYYLISRSLGPEFGGVIAIFFYIAQAIAVTLYVVGFTEAIFSALPGISLPFRHVATLANIAGFDPLDEDPDGTLIPFLQQPVDLPGDVLLVYNAGDVSLLA